MTKNFVRQLTFAFQRKGLLYFGIVLFFGIMCSRIAVAQSGASSIQGIVTDSTGAVIPGAVVHVVNDAAGTAVDTKTNGVGFYQLPGLNTGHYTLTSTAPGMKTYKTAIVLLSDQHTIINPTLSAGAVTEQVEVAAEAVQITTTDSGTIGTTLENARINQVPINGRTLVNLIAMMTPGLEAGGQRANGLMGEALEYVADGVTLANRNFGGMQGAPGQEPDLDSVQEVRVETGNSSAQYAEPGTVVLTTKSGTNALHGSLFETARNSAFGIAKGRSNPANYVAPHLVRNEFGASAGGPIVLPHIYHGKDKSFWFVAYERGSTAQMNQYYIKVPTTAMRQGDWSGLTNGSSTFQQLYDPSTTTASSNCNNTGVANAYCRTPFANNQLPTNRLAPTTKILYDILPQPTLSVNPVLQGNFLSNIPSFQVTPTFTFRLDHSFDEKNKAYLRYSYFNWYNPTPRSGSVEPASLAADGLPAGAIGFSVVNTTMYAPSVGFNHVFSPTFFSETIASGQWYSETNGCGAFPNINYETIMGLPNNFGEVGFPTIGSGSITPFNYGTQCNYAESQSLVNLDENLTKTSGRHQMQFGGRYRFERFIMLPDRTSDSVSYGAYATALEQASSGTNYTATPNTGYADADMFLGGASAYSVSLQAPVLHMHDNEFDGYFQDNYHMSRNLTANIGLRWEAHPAEVSRDGLNISYDIKNDQPVLINPIASYIAKGYTTQALVNNLSNLGFTYETPSQAGMPSTILRNYDFNFSPRVGLAYQPFGGKHGTVIRGAYGRYIYPIPQRNYIKNGIAHAPFVATYSQSYVAANQSPDGLPNYLLRAPQSVIMGKNSSNVVNSSSTNAVLPGLTEGSFGATAPPDFVTQVNATVEQAFKGSALRVTWLWTHGTNLDHNYDFNSSPSTYVWEMAKGIAPPNGGLSTIGTNQYAATALGPYDQTKLGNSPVIVKNGWSNDNELQAAYQRLFRHGVGYEIDYVWSKPFRVGGNTYRDGTVQTAMNYQGVMGTVGTMTSPFGTVIAPSLPPAIPAGLAPYAEYHKLDVFEQYIVDTAIPKQHIKFSGIVDLPVGRGKRFLGNANRFVDELVGGFQIAGDGNIVSQDFTVTSSNYGPTNPLKVYKHSAPIMDCRSGTCYKAYEWFNGYIAPTALSGNSCATTSKVISGLPSDWAPYSTPIDNTCGTANYGANNVQVTAPGLNGGAPATVAYSPGPYNTNPYSKTVLNGPINYTADLSLFKVFPITERVNLRFNVDTFNLLNMQGFNNPSGTDGTEQYLPQVSGSANTPRQIQMTLRLSF
jgi:hypothetical protein